MAVRYVSEFSFPSEYGFHKPSSSKSNRSLPASKSVPGKAHGGRVTTPQHYKSGGGVGKGGNVVSKGAGTGLKGERFKSGNDHTIAKTTLEKSSGIQKPAFAKGGSTTPQPYHGGGCTCSKCGGGGVKMAKGGMVQVQKKGWNREDSVSPGSPARMPPGQSSPNKAAAKNKFATSGENTPPATKQSGTEQRMSGWSDFKKGGQVKAEDRFERGARGKMASPDKQVKGDGEAYKSGGRIKNLGHYAHGGKVGAKYEKAAGTPKTAPGSHSEHKSGSASAKGAKVASKVSPGPKSTAKPKDGAGATRHEVRSGEPKMAKGGAAKRNAAIHAKGKLNMGALASLAGAMGAPHAPPAPGMAPPPPGMAPGMGAPPAAPMGPRAAPPMAGGPPMMSHGGNVRHVVIHHLSHRG